MGFGSLPRRVWWHKRTARKTVDQRPATVALLVRHLLAVKFLRHWRPAGIHVHGGPSR